MPYPIERKLVVGVSSSALFNLENEDSLYQQKGVEEYRQFQVQHKKEILPKGVAFPFIKKFLDINKTYTEEMP